MLDVGRHPNINLMAYSEVEKVEGSAGCFKVRVRRKARYVDEDKCTGCGACKEKCPTDVLDLYNEGHSTRKAIYSWFAQGIPSTHTIDPDSCRVLNGKKCGICQKRCEAGAIDFEQKDKIVDLEIGAIIAANGYTIFDPGKIAEYRYNDLPNVVTAVEFERFLSASGPTHGHIDRPSDVAVRMQIKELEKEENKLLKILAKFEEKHGKKSAEFFKTHTADAADPEQAQWAMRYEEYLPVKNRLAELQKKAETFATAKRLAFIQCVGDRKSVV